MSMVLIECVTKLALDLFREIHQPQRMAAKKKVKAKSPKVKPAKAAKPAKKAKKVAAPKKKAASAPKATKKAVAPPKASLKKKAVAAKPKKAAAPKAPAKAKKAAAPKVAPKAKKAAPPVKGAKGKKAAAPKASKPSKAVESAKPTEREINKVLSMSGGEEEAAAPVEVVLTDSEGRRYCRVKDCDQLASVDAYCRYHYLLFWKKIQIRKKILDEGKLEKYIEELTARYPDKYLDMLRKDLRSEKEFLAAIQELEIDDNGDDANMDEEDSQSYIDEVRGVSETSGRSSDDDY